MGIFKEDLINFGNLIDTEVEIKLSPEDFKRVFPSYEFEFSQGLVKIKGKKKGFLFSRSFEFRGGEDQEKVYNEREFETKDMGIYLKILSASGLDVLTKERGIVREGEHLRMSVYDVLKLSDIYQKIPDAFRDRLLLTRYKLRNGHMAIFVTVTK